MAEIQIDSSTILKQLLGEQKEAIAGIETRTKNTFDVGLQIDEIQRDLEATTKIRDERQRAARERVLTTTLEKLRSDYEKEQEDLAKAVFGLNAYLEKLGNEYLQIGELNDEEKKLIEDAKKRLEEAREKLPEAERKWIFKEAAIQDAKREIADSEKELEFAEREARSRARRRLMAARMDQALQEFQLHVARTIQIMENRMAAIDSQLKIVASRKAVAFKIREEAAKALEKLDKDLNAKEADLQNEEDKLSGLENGTPEYAEQSTKVSNLRAGVEELRGRRIAALALYQSKEKFAAELEIHERTQMQLRDNQRMWVTSLRSDTEERVVTFRSRLEAQKALADQDAAKELDTLGAEIDQRNLEFMASAGAASARLRMEKIETHPERIKNIAAVQAAQAESIAQIRSREQKMIEYFKEMYGVDPTESSFFHYGGGKETESAASA